MAGRVTVISCPPLAPDCRILWVARLVQVWNPACPLTGVATHRWKFDPLHPRSTMWLSPGSAAHMLEMTPFGANIHITPLAALPPKASWTQLVPGSEVELGQPMTLLLVVVFCPAESSTRSVLALFAWVPQYPE